MAYYAVLKLSIYYRYYLKVSIILGMHKVRARHARHQKRENHTFILFRRNVNIYNLIKYICTSMLYSI